SLFPENLAGKVVIITGASSGIGDHLAYEYAKHGACLALVARRKELLVVVAEKAKELGSPKAIVIKADVSSLEDCKTIVNETIKHFSKCKKSKGRIVMIGSCGGWFGTPKVSVYNENSIPKGSPRPKAFNRRTRTRRDSSRNILLTRRTLDPVDNTKNLRECNRRNSVDPIHLSFDEDDATTGETNIILGATIEDIDLKKPFKETLKSPFTRRIIEFTTPEHKAPTSIKLCDRSTNLEYHLGPFC
nr:11-beta-hydroxysteroid dehydrogenase-like 2 [Tanacetum cinerariifolium]